MHGTLKQKHENKQPYTRHLVNTQNNCTLLCRDVYSVPSHLARLLPHSLTPLTVNLQHTRKKKILTLYIPTFDDADAFNENAKKKY